MIEAFLKSIERLESLIRLKNDSKRAIFVDHVDPIYREVSLIANDYQTILADIRNELQQFDFSKGSGSQIISMLVKRRREHERTRESLKKYSVSLKQNNRRDDIQKFAVAVFGLLNIEPVTIEMIQDLASKQTPRLSTATTSLISDLTKVSITPESKRRALILINHYHKKIDKHLDLVTEAYFDLKTKCLV